MLSLETALRLLVIGQQWLIAGIFLTGDGNRGARLSGALLLLSVSAYLLISDAVLHDALGLLLSVVTLLAIIVPHSLWLFARAVFEVPWPRWWVLAVFVLPAIGAWAIFIGGEAFTPQVAAIANAAMRIASLVIVIHALAIAAQGRRWPMRG